MKIKTNGIETNYVIEGEGPWLAMSHSLACNLSMWDEQPKAFNDALTAFLDSVRGAA